MEVKISDSSKFENLHSWNHAIFMNITIFRKSIHEDQKSISMKFQHRFTRSYGTPKLPVTASGTLRTWTRTKQHWDVHIIVNFLVIGHAMSSRLCASCDEGAGCVCMLTPYMYMCVISCELQWIPVISCCNFRLHTHTLVIPVTSD